jgi:5-formyltetrahydrofolate cyclo-ligase
MPKPPPSPEKALRQQLRQQRAALPKREQQRLSRQIAGNLRTQASFRNARHIAIYLPVRGEADPRLLRQWGLPHQTFYLPVLSPFKDDHRLWFIRWDAQTRFRMNRFRIPEPYPRHHHQRPARWLDLVVMPLLAFDAHGTRMGMGGGFYDRTFAFKKRHIAMQRPRLTGFAYSFQQREKLLRQAWDIPLNAAVSDLGFFRYGTSLY